MILYINKIKILCCQVVGNLTPVSRFFSPPGERKNLFISSLLTFISTDMIIMEP